MNVRSIVIWCAVFTFGGCAASTLTREEESAGEFMRRADSLSTASAIPEAIGNYYIVAEQYSATRFYPDAVFKLGILFCSPKNPSPNDSVAAGWFHLYQSLPISRADSAYVAAYLTVLERISRTTMLLTRQMAVSDSLSSLLEKNSNDLLTHSKHVTELETQIKQMTDELEKMREVDVHMAKRGVKK